MHVKMDPAILLDLYLFFFATQMLQIFEFRKNKEKPKWKKNVRITLECSKFVRLFEICQNNLNLSEGLFFLISVTYVIKF